MFMLKARSRVVDVPGVVWVLTRPLFIVAVMLALLVSAGVAHAQGTPTVPTIESVAVTSDPGEDGGYAIGDEIQVGLTFSEAVTVTGAPQLNLDVGGRTRTAGYSGGTTTPQLLFTYTVLSGDEDTDGIAVVANSLALNGGAIRAGSANAALTHGGLQSDDHKVDGIAPTVTVGGETRTYVPPGRQFNVVFYFSEKVYGITDAEITVTNGEAHDVHAITSFNDRWPKYTRWDVIIVPAAEGPVSVTLEAGAATDAYGNGNTAPESALEVIAADPVMVEVTRTTSGFAEGGKAAFIVTRSRDNGAIPVSLSLDQTGDFLSGTVEVYPPPDPNMPENPVTPTEVEFTETPFTLNVTFAAGETSKTISFPTQDDNRDEPNGTVTLSVPARTDQYKYIPGFASSASADVRDNDVPAAVSLYWTPPTHPYDTSARLDTALEGGSMDLTVYGVATGQPLQVTLAVTEVGSYLDLDGEGAEGYENLGNGKLRVTLPVDRAFENVIIPLMENAVREADGSVTITIEPDPDGSYTPSVGFSELTVPVKDNDTPSTVSISAPDSITEGGALSYTLTRTWDPGQSWEELSVDVELEQTGDYITWPAGRQPDADGRVTIPVTFAARSLTATLTLETVDDEVSEDNGSVTATILADADSSYVTGADSDHATRLLDNDPTIISVSAVSAEVTEGTDAQFRFTRIGNTGVATRVGLYAGGLPKIMTDATEATVLTSQDRTVHIYGAFVDYILEFAAGETEKTLSFTTEADNVNEGDGWLGVRIVPRLANPFSIRTGYAQVHVHDDDVPTVSLPQPVGPTGLTLSADGTTWEGQIVETDLFTYGSVCEGVTEFSEDPGTILLPLALWVMYADHPAYYTESKQNWLGRNYANVRGVDRDCAGAAVYGGRHLYVGPENGVLEVELLPQRELVATGSPWDDLRPKVYDEFITKYEEAAAAAEAAGTLITQKGIFHPTQLLSNHWGLHCSETEFRYCPKYVVGTVNKIRLTVTNRDPVILIKAENSQVEEGQPARFVVERRWSADLLDFTTVVSLRASQNGQYITGALPTEITFGQDETRKVIEFQTVDDSAFSENGSVTIELLPDTTGADLNVQGKYTISENWLGHTPEGGRSDRATVTITNDDDKPGISIAPASAQEGDSGSGSMTFTVTLASPATEPVTVNYATSDGTAAAGQDYTAVSNGSVTIAAGNTTAAFTVSVTGDETDEPNETFKVTISLPSDTTAAAIAGGDTTAAAGTILDDDPAVVTVAPKKSPVTEGEEVVFVLTRTGVTGEELYILVDLEDPVHRRLMIAKFDAGAVTAELSVATENNDVVDYPSERDYTIQLYGDGHFVGRDDERYTPGDPGEATVTVQDNDTLVVVTVEPVTELVRTGESVQFRFRRTGSTAEEFTISFQGFEHPSSGDATLADASVTFLAGNDTVVYTNDVTSNGTVNPSARAHTVLIYGDAGRGGLHRSWIAGDPNRATVVVGVNNSITYMAMTASYPGRMAAGESVSVEYTVTNLGTRPLPGFSNRVWDGTQISTTPDRGSCDIRDDIPAGESRTCSASFTVTNQDVTNGKIEFNATARNHNQFSTVRVYIRVAQPVEFGFTTADTLEVTEGPDVTATLPVTRTGRPNEAVTVAYRLRKHGTRPASLGEDFTDPSSTPGLLTFPANVTSANIVINITQDQIDEERERFRVVLIPLTDGTITDGKESRVVRITDEHQDNDPYRPTASLLLVSADPTPENAGSVDFAIVLDRVWGEDARFEVELDAHDNLTATPAIATLGKTGDFEERLIHAAIPAGQTRFEFSLALYDDDVREEDETFQMLLSSSITKSYKLVGDDDTVLVTIADDDRVPPTEVVLSLSHNGGALESAPEGSTQQDITVTASFPQIRWPGDASNAPLRLADPRDVDTTVRVRFDPNSGATHAAGLDDFAPFKVEDDQGDFGEVESFDIVIPAGQTSGTTTLRFRPVNDDVDEEDETVTLLGSELVAGDSADSLPVRSASFTIIDDDTRGITVSPPSALIGLSLVEGGEPGTYSLVLDSQPTDTVVITLAGNQGGFLRIVPDSITFTTSDWATPQTVSVMALDDGIAGGGSPQDMVTHQVSGGDYGSETAPDILTSIEDTTEAFVYLEGGKASESDGHVEFTVTVRPILRTTPVLVRYTTVDGTAIAGSDYTREVETGQTYKILNIPGGQSSATIRIPITDDQVYESADETFTLHLTNHNNRATLDGGATPLTAIGTIADDDPKPVVNVSGPAGELSYVSEAVKDPVTFTLTLMGQSAGDVIVDYATGEAGLLGLLTSRQGPAGATEDEDYAGASGTVTFTSGQTTKTVAVQVTDDDVSEETEFFGFKISRPQGADLRGQRSEVVADVGLVDDDARGATIDPTSISLDEPASGETAVTDAYTVNLKSRPTDTVTVTIGGGDPAVSLSGDTLTNNRLTFTTTNWNTAQTITVTPVKDDNAVGETVTLTHTLSGGDYAGIAADSVTINLTDSDTRNLVLSRPSLTLTEGDAAGMTFTVRLATEPSDSVSVSITGHSGTDLTLSSDMLTFTVDDWDDAQTVTVTAEEDDDGVTDAVATLTHTASGGDYVNLTKDLPVTVTENDTAGVTVEPTALSVVAGRSNEYTVKLATQPTGEVTVTISGHASTDVSLSGPTLDNTTLTFTVGDWSMAQTVTVSATQSAATGKVTLTHAVAGADYASVTAEPVVVSVVAVAGQQPTIQVGVTSSTQTLTVPEGGSNSYTLVLSSRPTGDVAVGVTLPASTDLTLSSNMLTFTVNDWATAQTVTVKAGQDDDGVTDTATLTHTASGGDYVNVTKDLPVTVTENDTAGLVISKDNLTVGEGDAAGMTYTVALATQPSDSVSVSITGHSGTDLTLSSDMLTFTVDDWDDAQTVTVTAEEDDDGVTDAVATLTHTASGGDYVNVTKDLPVTVTENDTAGLVISKDNLTVGEGDAAGMTYTVALATQPSDSVSVSITGHDGTDLSLSGPTLSSDTLTFTVDDWDDAQTVTVTAKEDDDGVTDAVATLTHTASGGDYANVTRDLPVTVTDNDTAGVTIEPTVLSVVAGRSNEYTVKLATQPTGEVTVTISGHASTDVSLSGPTLSSDTLTFTTDNWYTAQTVTVSATESAATGKVTLTHAVAGADYASVTAEPVVVSVVAVAGQHPTIQVGVSSSTQTLTVPEGGSNSYTLVLSSRPTGDVAIGVTLPAGTDLRLDKTSLTFTTTNWDDAQTVTVTAAEDDDGVTDAGATLIHTISGGGYASTTVPDVEVSITENDSANIVLSEPGLTLTEGDAVGSSYTVKLATRPSDSVSVSITGHDGTDLSLSGPTLSSDTLTFTVNDWATAQTVTVKAGQDDDGVTDTATLTHTASGGDYVNVTRDLPVTVTDDDPQVTVKFGADTYTVSEGNTATITVTLSADPQSTVIIPLEATGQDGATSDDYHVPSSVTINGGETSKTFEFMAKADDVSDNGESVMIGFGTNLPSRVTKGTPKEARVTIRQMSPQLGSGVTVQFEADAYTVSEGSMATITVTLSADPQSTVVIPITATNQGGATSSDYSIVSSSVTFNSGDTSQTITFSAKEDTEDELGESVLLAFGTNLPSGVSAGTPSQTTVSIKDDCADGDIWCATLNFSTGSFDSSERLSVNQIDTEDFLYDSVDYQLIDIRVIQNGHHGGDDVNVKLPFGIPERTKWSMDFRNLNSGTGSEQFEILTEDWRDWTLHVSTVSGGDTLTAALRFSEARYTGQAWWWWFGRDIDHLRRVWQPGQLYKVRLVEDPRSERTPQPLNPPMYLRVQGVVNTTQVHLRWLGPQMRDDQLAPVDRYKIQWKESSGSWGMAADVSETITGPTNGLESHFLDALTAGFEYNIRVIATDSVGDSEPSNEITYTMPADAHFSVSNTPAVGEPRIYGTPETGQTLSADTTGITDDDGFEGVVFNYQWLADDAEVNGATGSTYTMTSDNMGKAITVRVDFTDDAGHDESVTSPPAVVTSADLELRSATVDGGVLTLTYNEVLDNLVSVPQTAFAVNVSGAPRSVGGVGFGESNVLLFLTSSVAAGDTVTVGYTAPDGTDSIRDTRGRKADSFTGQAVTNYTDPVPLTASAHNVPASHNGHDAFIFELRFSEDPKPDFSYTTVRDHAFTVTGGSVTYVRRLEPGENLRWDITVTPSSGADVAIDLNATTNCSAVGAICTGDGRMLSGGSLLVVPGPNTPPPPNTPATGTPTISGTAQVGETLTADTTDISDHDGLANATFAYQWLAADDAKIDSATASTYTLVAADEGNAIKVRVSFTDDTGNDEELTSAGTAAVAAAPPLPNTPAIGLPTISGTSQVGETLTADTTGISDDDGLGNANFAYQWLADDAEINGANASTYTLVATDVGNAIKVRVSFTDDADSDEELTSAGTAAVAAAPPLPNTPAIGLPTISGTAQVGETLTADTTGISDGDGLYNATFAYQWLADDAEINGATASSYTLVADEEGKAIKVSVSFTDDAGSDEELTSAATGAVAVAVVNPPLTASAQNVPLSHDGSGTFIFELRFSDELAPDFSYATMRDHALTVTGGSVTYVRRLEPPSNIGWEIHVTPDSDGSLTIVLPVTTDCNATGAICTGDGRKLSNRNGFTVAGPGQ